MKCVDKVPEYEYCEMENNKIMVFKDNGPYIYTKGEFEEKYQKVKPDNSRIIADQHEAITELLKTKYILKGVDIYNKRLEDLESEVKKLSDTKAVATYSSIHKYPPGSNITYISEDDLAPNSIKTHINVMWVFIIIITVYLILSKIF